MILHRLINHALEIMVPQIKTRVEGLREEWKCIQKFYNASSHEGLSEMNIYTTNLPSHLENMIRNLKEEEIYLRIGGDPTEQHCLDYILENNILVELLRHAQKDLPKGMKVQVLNFFTHFISNIHPHLLSQSSIRVSLERLVLCSYEIDEEDTLLKRGLVQLINVVVRHIDTRNELIELYFDGKNGSDFQIFLILLDYLRIPGQTGRVSREALLSLTSIVKGNKKFWDFLEKGAQFYETIDRRLKISFSSLPINNTFIADDIGSNTHKRQSSDGHGSSSIQPDDDPLRTYKAKQDVIEEFFDLWSFVNNVAGIECETIISRLLNTLSDGFFKYALVSGLLNPLDDQAAAVTAYVTRMIKLTKLQPMLNRMLSIIFGANLDPETALEEFHLQHQDAKKTTHVESLREILIERAGSSEDWLSLVTLRLFESIIESYNQFGLYNLVFRNLIDLDSVGARHDGNTMKQKRISSPAQINPEKFIKHLLTIMPREDRTSNIRSSKAVVIESMDKSNEKNGLDYEDYFLDAQQQVQMAAAICNNWSPSPPITKTESGDRVPSLNVDTNIKNQFFEGAFVRMLFEQLENFVEAPLERNLVITSILSKLACMLDERIDWLLYGEVKDDNRCYPNGGMRKNLIGILEKISSEAEKNSTKVPNFLTRIQLTKRRGMNNPRMSFRRGSSVDLDSMPISPVSPTYSNSLSASPTSAQYKDNTVNPFAKFTNFVNAFVVLQEFCKELAAIIFVKYVDLDKGIMIVEEEEEETEEVLKINYRKSHSKYRHEKQKSMSFLGNSRMTHRKRLSESAKDDIALLRNGEKFARLMERQQINIQTTKHSYR